MKYTGRARPIVMGVYREILSSGLKRGVITGENKTLTPKAYNTILERFNKLGGYGFKKMEVLCQK
tara:strand:+ start:21 stop:215 length:195 start_codon:yes stop_codon:yes gene_type:complete